MLPGLQPIAGSSPTVLLLGSLDARIDLVTAIPNDIGAFLREKPSIRMIGLNGGTACKVFERKCRAPVPADVQVIPLPSSSSAHAAMSFAQKVEAWSVIRSFTSC